MDSTEELTNRALGACRAVVGTGKLPPARHAIAE